MSQNVRKWLEGLDLGQFASVFADQQIDHEVLPDLTDEDLEKLGIPLGPRKKILKAIGELERGLATPLPEKTPRAATPDTSHAERRQLTVMFCDLVGSTELSQKLDPEDLRDVNRAYQDACKGAIERYEGYVARYMGDGVLAYFGYPQAHEDDAERAVRAGLGLVHRMSDLNAGVGREKGIDLSVRVGVTTGPVVVGDLIGEGASQESAVVGETPNLAARLQALAASNTVVIGPGTHDLAGGRFEYEDLGTQELKGIAEPVETWRVIAPTAGESRFEVLHKGGITPLVGREHEIGLLLDRWEQAKEGDGQVVLLSGEAGIGKSHLTQSLRERTVSANPIRLRYQCSPYHINSALHPVIEQLEWVGQLAAEDSPEVKLEKLQAVLAQSAQDVEAVAPLFAALMSIPAEGHYAPLEMTPERQKAKTLEALATRVDGLSRHRPVLLIFEDVHWADPTSLELMELIVERVQNVRVMMLITFRPEFVPPWTEYTHITSLTLNRFSRSLVTSLVEKIAGGKPLPDEVLDAIVEKTDGVPLFVEELTKTVVESDLIEDRGDHFALTGPLALLAIPSTLQGSLMARLDRVAPVKEVAQLAAVIGREFAHNILTAVSPLTEDNLRDALDQLLEAGLIFHRGTLPKVTYRFKHALVQDAAYASLLKSTRRQLHGRIANVLENEFLEISETQPELLAYHYRKAGLSVQAIDYYQQAGERAAARSANIEAISHFNSGLDVLDTLPETRERSQKEYSLYIALGPPQIATKGYGSREVERAYNRARELCEQLGEIHQLFPVLRGLWMAYSIQGELRKGREFAEQLLTWAENSQELELLLEAHAAVGISRFWFGEIESALEQLDRGLALYDIDQHRSHALLYAVDPGVGCLTYGALCLWLLGFPDQALARIDEGIALGSKISHPFSSARAFNWAAMLHQFRRETQSVKTRAQKAIELSKEYGFPHWLAQGMILQGRVLFDEGQEEKGIAQMHDSFTAYLSTGAMVRKPFFLSLLAEPNAKIGKIEEGFTVLDEALAAALRSGERWWESELHRLKGELLLVRGTAGDDAEACFRQAVEIAREQSAKSLVLRAATSLARLWRAQGKRQEGYDLLAPIYDWFTEGFDTPDLCEAKTLLEELS